MVRNAGLVFRHQIEPFRVIGNSFMRSYVGDGWAGKLSLRTAPFRHDTRLVTPSRIMPE